ncbi:MAG: 30S ribosomal protein S3 [Nanoarchaeota archaeon]
MIERKFVSKNMKEHQIKEYISKSLNKAGLAEVRLVRTPLGEKIVIAAARPGLVVGRAGANIAKLTKEVKERFGLENPQIEIEEVQDPMLDATIVAESIASALERFGSSRFKGIGHKSMTEVMNSGALGVEILISGKIPSSRAKTWRFYQGYLKKSGDIAVNKIKKAEIQAKLKSGIIGIRVKIMPPDIILPDRIRIKEEQETVEKETPADAEKTKKQAAETKESPKETKTGKDAKETKKPRKKPTRKPKEVAR